MENVHFSSKSDEWATPQDFFDKLNEEFNFTLDACATHTNHKCDKYFTLEEDGLIQSWGGYRVFCNPPYSQIKDWAKKSSESNTLVVMLIPARTDTRYFHEYIYQKQNVEIRFVKGRLIFGDDEYWKWLWDQELINNKINPLYKKYGKKNSAPFPSMVVIFNNCA